MCGIFASVGFPPQRDAINIVSHRGPDGDGWKVFTSPAGPVALGHRRLAIIDMTDAALQPMSGAEDRFQIVFNGEIYNYVELRDDLVRCGDVFSTDSDTEVLLRAFTRWGEACLARLRGMFAFVVWDRKEKVLFAARDRFGIKPLYYTHNAHGFALASEIKQLLVLPSVERRANVARVHDFLLAGMADHTDETMFVGCQQIRGGECVTISTGKAPLQAAIRRWYPVNTALVDVSERVATERFKALLSDSVRIHLRSDVPVGSCLSGGLDSSSLVCLMANMLGSRSGGGRVQTVSACYAEKSVDEKPFMDAVVSHAHTVPHFVFPNASEVFARSEQITWHQDEPFGSTSIFAQWCVFEEAKKAGLKVMLDGQGADEQLAGYHGCYYYLLQNLAKQRQIGELLQTIWQRRRLHKVSLRDQFESFVLPLLPPEWHPRLRRFQVATPVRTYGWLDSDIIRERGNPLGAMTRAVAPLGLDVPHDVASFCFATSYASNLALLLHWEDRNSMAHSTEARVPFVDHPLIEFSLSLGGNHKLVRGVTKKVLRGAMRDVLPAKIAHRHDKLGFATPEEIWFKGRLRPLVEDGVRSTLSLLPGLVDKSETEALTRDTLDGRRPFDFAPWRIVSLGHWAKRYGVSI